MAVIENQGAKDALKDATKRIGNEDTGTFVVTTESGSRYIIDLDARTLVRHHDDESDWHGDLNRGGLVHGLVNITDCTVNQGMVVIIDQALPGYKEEIGARFTTTVVRIDKL